MCELWTEIQQPKAITMTRADEIVVLVWEGFDDTAIADQVGCSRDYVRVVRQRNKLAKPRSATSHRATLDDQIAEFADENISEIELFERFDASGDTDGGARQRSVLR